MMLRGPVEEYKLAASTTAGAVVAAAKRGGPDGMAVAATVRM
jgi:hypothetical protein